MDQQPMRPPRDQPESVFRASLQWSDESPEGDGDPRDFYVRHGRRDFQSSSQTPDVVVTYGVDCNVTVEEGPNTVLWHWLMDRWDVFLKTWSLAEGRLYHKMGDEFGDDHFAMEVSVWGCSSRVLLKTFWPSGDGRGYLTESFEWPDYLPPPLSPYTPPELHA